MKLNNEQYEALHVEMMALNEENIDGKFFVNTINELKKQAVKYLKDEYFDEETINNFQEEGTDISSLLNNLWKDKGIYVFVGLHWETGYNLYHITEIFELQTDVSPLIFFGDEVAIENEKRKWFEQDNYIYTVWDYDSNLETFYYCDEPEDNYAILKSLILSHNEPYMSFEDIHYYTHDYELEKYRRTYFIKELHELDNHEFYDFLRQYAEQVDLL